MNEVNADVADLSGMEAIYETYSGQPGALIPILQKAQELYGYLPPEALQWIADRLDVALGKVYGVATFYSQFYLEGRGKHVLKLCDGTACHVKGAQTLVSAVEGEYHIRPGETTEDGELTVEVVYCLGSCALAPVAVLDGEIMARVEKDELLASMEKRLASEPTDSGQGGVNGVE
ncbi:MAG: NAD(P)H-dependent oxidoreductase subunit E [Anaerolineae bacterium]|nr:NAD(P)H-dependent oxidoreductase subunit E [Anaerolineae bacterium]